MPPRGNKGGRRPGVGKRRRNAAKAAVVTVADAADGGGNSGENDDLMTVEHRFDAASASSAVGLTIGRENTRKWALLKEAFGYVNDEDFAAFLLHLAEQQQPMTSSSTSDSRPNTDNSNNDNNDNGGNEPNEFGHGNDQSRLNDSSDISKNEEPQQQPQEQPQQNENEGQKGETEQQEMKLPAEEDRLEDENETLSEDDKDIDWTPTGFRELRCTRQSTRAATLKSRQGVRKTRSHLELAQIPTKKIKRKRASALTAARKIPVTSTSIDSLVSVLNVDSATKLPSVVDKVRLCIDCSQKHLHGECPLVRPVLVVVDSSVSSVIDDDNDDNIRRPLSQLTIPKIVKLATTDKIHGLGVVAVEAIHQYTQFGPLVGQRIEEADIHEDMDLKNIWEIFGSDFKLYVDTADENTSNWLRCMRPASSKSERNVSAIAREDNLYFVTVKDVDPGTELLYWAEDPTISWSKKKMEKTSCGGCNQRFRHPLYYRMHCMIFHDPNYSLTIRKYHCKICGIAVLGKENIMRHASEMHEGKGAYQCQYCKKFFLRLNYLDMHRTYGCKLNPRRSRPLCDLCGKKFCQPQKLKVHIRRMHSDISEVLKEFQCKSCFKLLGSRAALQRHLKEVHNKDQNIAATCDRCGKTFQNKSNLKIHMLTHSGVKPFRCTENSCMAAFTTKQCLQFHYKKVHGYTLDSMPAIERCIAYTFESYSGGASDNEGNGVSEIHSRLDDPKSVASVVTTTNSDLDSSSMCSSSIADFSVVKETIGSTAIVGDLLERRVLDNVDTSAISVDHHHHHNSWMEERNDVCEREPSPLSNDPEPLAQIQSNESEQERVIVVNDMNEVHNDVIDDVDMRRNEDQRSPDERTMVAEVTDHQHLESRMDSIVKSEQLDHGETMEDMPTMRQHFDDEDAEQMDSSDVDLESEMDDNSVSDHSLDLEHQEDDSSDLMVPSPRHQPPPICHNQEQLSEVERIHARNIVMYESTGLVRHLIKDSEGSKEYHGDVDFSAVRHYAASMAAHNDYNPHVRQSSNQTANDNGLHHQHNHSMHHEEVAGLVSSSSAEDLRGQLSRYELERGGTPIKTEDEEMDINVGGDHHLGKSVHLRPDDNEDLLVTPDDDDEEDEDVIRQQREDVTAALVLAHQEQEMVHDYVRHPPPMHHSARDMDRLSMHSLDLSIPRTTAHLLEHLARTTPHVLEHLANRGCGPPPPSPPDEQSVDHLPRPSSHGNLHIGQLGGPFHGMEALARPLPHRLDHMSHLQSSHPMDHMSRPPSQQPQDMESHMSPRLDPMSPPLPPHTPLDSMPHSLNYVVDHLARLPSSHGMDTFSRSHMGGSGGGGSSAMDSLIRSGVEALARPSPRPGSHRMDSIGRSFSAYGIEHSVGGGQSSAAYLLPPHGSGSDHLSRPPSAYSLDQRSTPHSLDLTMSRAGGGGGGMDSPSQSHDGGGRTMSPPSYQECSPPTASSSSSSFQASAMTSSASQLPPLTPSPVPTSIHSAYPTYLEYY